MICLVDSRTRDTAPEIAAETGSDLNRIEAIVVRRV
jgi:hypothetical protein